MLQQPALPVSVPVGLCGVGLPAATSAGLLLRLVDQSVKDQMDSGNLAHSAQSDLAAGDRGSSRGPSCVADSIFRTHSTLRA